MSTVRIFSRSEVDPRNVIDHQSESKGNERVVFAPLEILLGYLPRCLPFFKILSLAKVTDVVVRATCVGLLTYSLFFALGAYSRSSRPRLSRGG